MTCKECGQVVRLTRTYMKCVIENTELSNHGVEPVQQWWKPRAFSKFPVPAWMKELLENSQAILLALEQKIKSLTLQLETAAEPNQARGFGALTSVVIDVRFASSELSILIGKSPFRGWLPRMDSNHE
jgi:hypothetical protein